jgi:hypothetical protein
MRLVALALTSGILLAQEMPVEEKQTIRKTFAAARRIEVDNVNGFIHVSGYDGSEIQATIQETIRGETRERIAEARKEAKLDITESGDLVRFCADGPFRCHCGNWRHPGYRVAYDFEIKAPRTTAVFLHTVNQGDIKVENMAGDYDLNNINGGIEMLEAAGSGRVYALNGKVRVVFRQNPPAASTFGSLNGTVDLYFQPDLAADLRMKTFNGRFYTDFDLTSLAARAVTPERKDGKLVYHVDRYTGARVGRGGPEIKLDGFNGDIRILKRESQK